MNLWKKRQGKGASVPTESASKTFDQQTSHVNSCKNFCLCKVILYCDSATH